MGALPPFADISDLVSRGLVIPSGMEGIASQLLDDASAHLRGVIESPVWPTRTVSIDLYQHQGDVWLPVPVSTVRSISSMTVDGTTVDNPRLIDGALYVIGPAEVSLTLVAGLDEPPEDLTTWTCVLAAEAFKSAEELGTLSPGLVASVGVDDYRKSWQQTAGGTSSAPFTLPEAVESRLRNLYGPGTATVVGTR